MEIEFPIEFIVSATPVSFQGKLAKAEWKARLRSSSSAVLPAPHFASARPIAVTLFYFPAQVERIVVQEFEPGNVFPFGAPSAMLEEAPNARKPLLYIRLSDDPFEALK